MTHHAPEHLRLKRISEVALQLLIVAALGWVLLRVLGVTASIVIPVAIGALLAALLEPLQKFLRPGLPKYVRAGIIMLAFLGLLVLGFWASGNQLIEGFDEFYASLPEILARGQAWLNGLDLGFGTNEIESALSSAQDWLATNSSEVAKRALAAGSSAVSLVVATVMALVTAFFFLADGRNMWLYVVNLFPHTHQAGLDRAASKGWVAVRAYVRTQTIVAGVDALGIAVGAYFLGLPFVGPIAMLVFMTAFIPVVGAFLSGALAVLVALAFAGPKAALIMVLIVLAVQQAESNLLQPLLMGKALSLHPFAVIIAVSAGGYLAGIVGALFAVPLLAFGKEFLGELYRRDVPPQLSPAQEGMVAAAAEEKGEDPHLAVAAAVAEAEGLGPREVRRPEEEQQPDQA